MIFVFLLLKEYYPLLVQWKSWQRKCICCRHNCMLRCCQLMCWVSVASWQSLGGRKCELQLLLWGCYSLLEGSQCGDQKSSHCDLESTAYGALEIQSVSIISKRVAVWVNLLHSMALNLMSLIPCLLVLYHASFWILSPPYTFSSICTFIFGVLAEQIYIPVSDWPPFVTYSLFCWHHPPIFSNIIP